MRLEILPLNLSSCISPCCVMDGLKITIVGGHSPTRHRDRIDAFAGEKKEERKGGEGEGKEGGREAV